MDHCMLCGKGLVGKDLVYDAELKLTFCKEHAPLLRTCHSCGKAASCAFEQDPSPLPKQVAQVQQQGNVTMQTIVRNPERITITCKAGCPCYHDEFGCWREYANTRICVNDKYEYGGNK